MPERLPGERAPGELGEALQKTGMTADEAALVMGGNLMRVAGKVWG